MIKKINCGILFTILLLLLFAPDQTFSQEKETAAENSSLRVFLDRFWDWEDFIKEEMRFLTYVRDTRQAQVYILLTQQHTSTGGDEFTITYVGQENFSGVNDTLKFVSNQDDTEQIQRTKVLKYLKMGLMRYVSRTTLAEGISIDHSDTGSGERPVLEMEDKWNFWVFRIASDFDLEAEESYKESSLEGYLSANRTTEDWKIRLNYESYYREDVNETEEETYRSYRRSNEVNGLIVKSINDHWSAGIISRIDSDTRVNTKLLLGIGPAIEYNIFPYSRYTRQNLTFRFSVNSNYVKYRQVTIFDKTSENLNYASLAISGEIIEKWGDARMSLDGNVYFHDTKVNKLEWDSNIDIRLFKGFSLDMNLEISLIHDQLYLAKGDHTVDEILLKQTQLKTNWRTEARIGISYTFGSPFDSIVNPRFGEH
ncbi:hypothetical protein ACFL4T_02235 [candidate division KSB1 bacterium]